VLKTVTLRCSDVATVRLYIHKLCPSSHHVVRYLVSKNLLSRVNIVGTSQNMTAVLRAGIVSVPALKVESELAAIDPLEPEFVEAILLRNESRVRDFVPKSAGEAVEKFRNSILAIADTPREIAEVVISYLKRRGIKVIMLTGDNAVTAKSIARKLGIDEVIAEVLPEDKIDVIKDTQRKGVA